MKKIIILASLLVSLSTVSFAQTAKEVRERYGEPTESFAVTENIWMTPKYNAAGQVCSMQLYPRRVFNDAHYSNKKLDALELKEFIEKVAPITSRGSRQKANDRSLMMEGFTLSTWYEYAMVEFVYNSIFYDPSGNYSKVADIKSGELVIPHDLDFVRINWTKRDCP